MFVLVLEYMTAHGDRVESWLPVFDSVSECEWWRVFLTKMLEDNHATNVVATCQANW